mmetsp:Transcript_9283/g.13344  ORF Transcript_9283/g.13344 Transcript_9283/m.13344 type:complete len:108 (-) Transcript_9283:83-406(-)
MPHLLWYKLCLQGICCLSYSNANQFHFGWLVWPGLADMLYFDMTSKIYLMAGVGSIICENYKWSALNVDIRQCRKLHYDGKLLKLFSFLSSSTTTVLGKNNKGGVKS